MRDLSTGFETQIDGRRLRPLLLNKAEFDSGDILLWTGQGDLEFNGETYLGGGLVLQLSTIEETQELRAVNTVYQLSGIPSALVSLALSENYQGRPITTLFGVLDDSDQLETYQIYSGIMDTMSIDDDIPNGEAVISISSESDLVALRNAVDRNYTPEDQKIFFAGDLGLDFVPTIQDIEIPWGPPSS